MNQNNNYFSMFSEHFFYYFWIYVHIPWNIEMMVTFATFGIIIDWSHWKLFPPFLISLDYRPFSTNTNILIEPKIYVPIL